MRVMYIIWLCLALGWAQASGAPVRVEISATSVEAYSCAEGASQGLALHSVVPKAGEGRTLESAILWLECTARVKATIAEKGGRGCLVATLLGQEDVAPSAIPATEIAVMLGEQKTVCMDITSAIKEQMQENSEAMTIVIQPCDGDLSVGSVEERDGATVVGWIEYEYVDQGKRDRLMAH